MDYGLLFVNKFTLGAKNVNVKPNNIIGAVANEARLDSKHIEIIQIFDNFSVVDLPEGMPKDVLSDLKKAWVAGQQLNISLLKKERKSRKPSLHKQESIRGKGSRKGFLASKEGRRKKRRRK